MNEKELSKYVGNRIKEERLKLKMTQKELGEIIGVKHNTISAYELGRNAPEQNAIFKIAAALHVKVDDLFPNMEGNDKTDDFERALKMASDLKLEDMNFLNELIKKALSLDEEEREKFFESIKFTVDYYNKMNDKG